MKIIYVVYREDNTMVFDSQVLEYLKILKKNNNVSLMVFRNHVNMFKKNKVENKISKYLENYITFTSLPPLALKQLDLDALRLNRAIKLKYSKDEPLLIICRGELSTYIASKAFSEYKKSKILFDNRGLPVEELEMRNEKSYIYKKNKEVKYKATLFSKENSDIYSFVTNNLREYLVRNYSYSDTKPYYILPTLSLNEKLSINELVQVKKDINYNEENFYVTYIGSIAAWQNINQIFEVFEKIKNEIPNAILLFLTNSNIQIPTTLSSDIKKSIIIRSVNHSLVRYYLHLSNVGLVLRNNNIVNKVAAPTKIAEYITSHTSIIYSGEIGIIEDLKKVGFNNSLISLSDENLVKRILDQKDNVELLNLSAYFNMEEKQNFLINDIKSKYF